MTGPGFVLQYGTALGVTTHYFSDTKEGYAALKETLANLSGPLVYFVRIFRQDTENVLAQLNGGVYVPGFIVGVLH